jgi:hypothetical protein
MLAVMPVEMFSHVHNVLAFAYIYYWVVTLEPALSSWDKYMQRTYVTAGYWILTWSDHGKVTSNFEWAAGCLVLMHFVSVINVFFYGDVRRPMRKKM